MKKLFFDLDGTIIDSSEGIYHSILYALEKMALLPLDNATLQTFIGPPLLDSFKNIGLNDEQAAQAVAYYREIYANQEIYQVAVYPEIAQVLAELSMEKNYELYIATSKPEIFAKKILNYLKIAHFFKGIYGADLENTRNSKTDVLAFAIKNAGKSESDEMMMIGDRAHDIIGAKSNGIKSIGVLYGFGDQVELERAGADFIVTTPMAIRNLFLEK